MSDAAGKRTIRVGGVGIGRGESLCGTASRDHRVQLVAVCDLDIEVHVRRGLAARYESRGIRIEKLYDSFEKFLEHDMDAVIIATPPPCHARQSVAAMNAGMSVLCEIPAAMTIAEAKELVLTARKTGMTYMTAENCCYLGMTRAWQKIIQDGRIGKVLYAEGEYIHDVRHMFTRNWTDAAFPDNPLGGSDTLTWRAKLHPARYCTHEIGPLLEILNDRVVQVMAADTGSNVSRQTGTIDMAVALMRTANGAIIKELTGFAIARPGPLRYFCIYGVKGCLETARGEGDDTLAYFEDVPNAKGMMRMPIASCPRKLYPSWVAGSGHGGTDAAMVLDFIDCIAERKPSPIDVYRGLDYTLPGIVGVASVEEGGVWLDVPDPRSWA